MTQLEASVPTEPAEKSVVLDRWGRAWQRSGDGWRAAGEIVSLFGARPTSWSAVLIQCGPVRLVHDGAADPTGPTPEVIAAAAAAKSERETWRMARAQLAQALDADRDATWPVLLEDARQLAAYRNGMRDR